MQLTTRKREGIVADGATKKEKAYEEHVIELILEH